MTDVMNNSGVPPESAPPERVAAPAFTAASQPSYARTLFFGPDGLRPGWGFLFYALMFYPMQMFANHLAWSHNFGASGLWSIFLQEVGDFVAAVIPALVLERIERRPFSAYGLTSSQAFGKPFWVGTALGFFR